MSYEFNHPILKPRRRKLRRNQTEEEKFLWEQLRNRRLGQKFYRQFSIGPYILDFYCSELRLGVELDGRHHEEEECQVYDRERDEYLKDKGVKVLRIRNQEMKECGEQVLEKIRQRLTPPTTET